MTFLDDEIRRLMRKDPHVVAIHEHRFFDASEMYDVLLRLERKHGRKIRHVIDYINAPCVEDDFGTSHIARWEWREKIIKDERIRNILKNDPLRANNATVLFLYLYKIKNEYDGPHKEELEFLYRDIFDSYPSNYPSLSFDEKIASVIEIKEKTCSFLILLSGFGRDVIYNKNNA